MAGYLGIPRAADARRLPGPEPARPRRHAADCATGRRSRSATSPASARRRGCTTSSRRSRMLRQTAGAPACRLRVSGWLGENNRPYFDEQCAKAAGRRAGRRLRTRRIARPRRQGALPASPRRAVRADDVPRAEGAVRAGGAGQRRAGRAAAARLVPGVDRGDRRRPAGRAGRPGRPGPRPARSCSTIAASADGWRRPGKKAVLARFTAETHGPRDGGRIGQYHQRHDRPP